MSDPDLQETIEALDATRKILMSGDGEWADAEEMDRRVTDAITLLKAQQEEIEDFEAALIKIEQMLESYTAYNYPETIDEALRIARTALIAFAENTGKIPGPPPETDNE
jgi:hypothetical protein